MYNIYTPHAICCHLTSSCSASISPSLISTVLIEGETGGGGAMHKIILKFNSLQNCLRLRVCTYTPRRAAIFKYFFYHSIKGNGWRKFTPPFVLGIALCFGVFLPSGHTFLSGCCKPWVPDHLKDPLLSWGLICNASTSRYSSVIEDFLFSNFG